MNKLVLPVVEDKDLGDILSLLKSKRLLLNSGKCHFCRKKPTKIGGFLPEGEKIALVCDKIQCSLDASFAIMKLNGNGSPILEK